MIWFLFMLVYPAQGEIQNHSLEIIKGNTILNAGSELQLKCNIEADVSNITFKWFKDNNQISIETSQMLTINSITKEQAGVYYCSAKNGTDPEKSSSTKLNITVNYLENAVLTISPTALTINESDSITFTCTVDTNLNPVSYSFQRDGNGTTTDGNEYVISKVMKSDSGSYTCIVSASASTTPPLSVTSDPVLLTVNELFQAPTLETSSNTLNSGESLTLTCRINTSPSTAGIEYKFWKDTANITSFQSSFTHTRVVQSPDSGKYTCEARLNNVEKKSPDVNIAVKLNVSVTITPTIERQNMTIKCNVEGGTAISFSWKENNVTMDGKTKDTIVVQNVDRSMIGTKYSCIATSQKSIPSDEASATVSLSDIYYESSAVIIIPTDKNEGKVGESVTMACNTSDYGNPPAVLTWYRSSSSTTLFTGKAGEAVSFIINPIIRDSTGNYTCNANNTAGEIEKMFRFVAIDKPDSPTLKVSSKTPTSITVLITPPAYTGNKPITYYTLQYQVDGKDISKNITDLTNLVYNITELKPAVNYQVRVQAVNDIGVGQFSEFINATTGDAVKASGLIIKPADKNEGKVGEAFNMTCYTSDYGIPPAVLTWYRSGNNTALSTGNAGEAVSYTINSVTRDSTGNYICKANNKAGEIEKKFPFKAIDKPDPPNFQGSSSTSTSITVLIIPPAYTGNKPITYYTLQYQGEGKDISKNTTNLVYNITELTPAVKYHVRVQAVNVIGAGQFSEFINITTGEALPSVPKQFGHDTIFRPQKITLSWLKPTPSNGLITNYKVCYIQDTNDGVKMEHSVENCNDVGNVTTFTLTGLGFYNGYNVSVSAENSAGFGPNATLHQIVTLEGVPTEVQSVSLTAKKRSIDVTWKRPKHIYGILHGYTVKYRLSSENTENDVNECIKITKLSCTIYNLQPLRKYTVIVTVFNSLFSNSSSNITQTLVDAPPPLDKDLPDPPADKIEETSFAMNILKFKETNGKIDHYDVIAMKRTNSLYSKKPQDIRNNDIKTFVVGRLKKVVDNQLFIVGGGQTSNRKRRALGTPNNGELEEDTTYVVFVRAYVNKDLYQSTSWYTPVKTAKSKTDDCQPAKIIIVSVLVTLVITLLVYTIVLATLKQKGLITVNKKRNEKPQNVETDDYEVAGTTHYADLNIQDSKPSFYTDLKTMNDHSNDYAEIELSEAQKNIYVNVKK